MDDRGFHVTRSIDYIYVLDGEVILDLEEDRVVLKPGDLVVQQATKHAWRNSTDKPARFIDVLTSAII